VLKKGLILRPFLCILLSPFLSVLTSAYIYSAQLSLRIYCKRGLSLLSFRAYYLFAHSCAVCIFFFALCAFLLCVFFFFAHSHSAHSIVCAFLFVHSLLAHLSLRILTLRFLHLCILTVRISLRILYLLSRASYNTKL